MDLKELLKGYVFELKVKNIMQIKVQISSINQKCAKVNTK